MSKKTILGLLVIAALGAGLWWLISTLQEKTMLELMPAQRIKGQAKEVGYGWSVKDTVWEAATEAVAMMKNKMGGKNPDFVFLWYTIGYDPTEVQAALRGLLGQETKIQGNSSAVAVISPDGYHQGKVGALAIMGIPSDKATFGVGGADLDKLQPREAGKKATEEAMLNAKKEGNPQFIYVTAAPGKEEDILLGIRDVIGEEVPIFGGSSGDETLTGRWSQMANDTVYKNGVVLTVVYTSLKIGSAQESGYMKSIEKGRVTRAEGRTIYELDGQPAGEVYNRWTGGYFTRATAEGGNILAEATFYPLATLVKGRAGETYLCVSHPGAINATDKSLTMLTNIKTGDEIQLLHGNWEWLINRAQSTARSAMLSGSIGKGEGLFAFYVFGAGNLLSLPRSERPRIANLLRGEMGDIPFVGGFTLGEQLFLPGVGNRHANLVNSLVIFK